MVETIKRPIHILGVFSWVLAHSLRVFSH